MTSDAEVNVFIQIKVHKHEMTLISGPETSNWLMAQYAVVSFFRNLDLSQIVPFDRDFCFLAKTISIPSTRLYHTFRRIIDIIALFQTQRLQLASI